MFSTLDPLAQLGSSMGRPPGLCYKYRDTGFCSYGARCKFSHAIPRSPSSLHWLTASALQRRVATLATPAPQSIPRASSPASATYVNHIATFFNSYPTFDYDAGKGAINEWRRLCRYLGADPAHEESFAVRILLSNLRTALVRQFNHRYGVDVNSLAAWQGLCLAVGKPVSDTLSKCRETIRLTYVNIVDLIELDDGAVIELFPTEVALRVYSKRTGKILPPNHLEGGALLRALLRHIDIRGATKAGRHRRR